MKGNWRSDNCAQLLINGEEFFPHIFESIRKAREEVLIETFILYEDEVGQTLQQALIAAAKRGVKVSITADGYGTWSLSEAFTAPLVDAGVQLHIFNPKSVLWRFRLNVFRRLHRKLAVIDRKVAYIGGINFSADHLLTYGPKAKQDYALKLCGPIVQDIHHICMSLLLRPAFGRKGANKPTISDGAPLYSTAEDARKAENTRKAGDVRMLMVERDNKKHRHDIEARYLSAIRTAQTKVIIANAYFFPGYRLLRELRRAAERNVEVVLILQGQPDLPWVSMLTSLLHRYLLKAKVKIYEYNTRPFHGKVALVDDNWATLGSSNLDPLSLSLNLEANVIIEDGRFNQLLWAHLQGLIVNDCRPLTMRVAMRGYWWRTPFIFLGFHFLRRFPVILGWLPDYPHELKRIHPKSQ